MTRTLPTTLSMGPACDLLGIAKWTGYELAKRDEFPVPVLHLGRAIRVPTRPLVDLLGLDVEIVLATQPEGENAGAVTPALLPATPDTHHGIKDHQR